MAQVGRLATWVVQLPIQYQCLLEIALGFSIGSLVLHHLAPNRHAAGLASLILGLPGGVTRAPKHRDRRRVVAGVPVESRPSIEHLSFLLRIIALIDERLETL